ncbi:hypothetical protein NDU88_001187 [Pleurodeles waltl]|uniref:Uncharacterized protein n=1 Tax=Pleurodeles waltl TaxID=8319 RepID=A0AAV7UVG0_PLEWA|nr:hypothetical protein NDU88_001187 [Pleurodeles waltl]
MVARTHLQKVRASGRHQGLLEGHWLRPGPAARSCSHPLCSASGCRAGSFTAPVAVLRHHWLRLRSSAHGTASVIAGAIRGLLHSSTSVCSATPAGALLVPMRPCQPRTITTGLGHAPRPVTQSLQLLPPAMCTVPGPMGFTRFPDCTHPLPLVCGCLW